MVFESKKSLMQTSCVYGMKNFCDGSPNLSLSGGDKIKAKPPCPEYASCKLRKTSIFDKEGDND